MVQRFNLNKPAKERLADIIRQRKEEARSSKTGAAGVKDLGENGDVIWTGIDPVTGLPVEKSVKRFSVDLDDTTGQVAELEADLNDSKQRLDVAEDSLDDIENITIPVLEAADQAARNDLNQLQINLNGLADDVSEVTITAGEAHNAAVEANNRLDDVRTDLANGPSLWEDPSFERGQGGLPSLATGRIERSQEWSKSGVWSIKYTATGSGGNNYGTYGWIAAAPDRWYMVTTTVYAPDFDQCINTTWDARTAPTSNGADLLAYVLNPGENTVTAGQAKTMTWFFQTPAGTKYLRYWIGQHSHSNTSDKIGQTVFLDDFRVVDVTDSYPRYLAAQQAAEAAQNRAEEAYDLADAAATPAELEAAKQAAITAAEADATAKAEQAEADAAIEAARVAQEKADEAQANAELTAEQKAAAAEAAAKAWALAEDEALEARAAADAKAKADQALADANAALAAARGEITTEIQTSVNGKNTITISTAAPGSTVGKAVGDLWWRVDTSGRIYGQWTWSGSAWTSSTIRNEMIANLDVHKLQVTGSATIASAVIEKLWVDGLAARAVTTMRLTVAPGNIFPDPYFQQAGSWSGPNREVVTDPDPRLNYLRITTSTSAAGAYFGGLNDRSVFLESGASYRVRFQARFSSTTSDANRVRLIARGDFVDGPTGSNTEVVFTRTSSGVWETYEGILDIPAGRKDRFTLGFYSVSPYAAGGTIDVRQVEVIRRAGAVLIEDGVITAPKVNAESIAAAVAAFIELDVANLRVIGTADIQEAVAQKLAAATASFQEAFIQNLRTNGAVIDTAVIDDLAANLITSGLFRTAETGQRWEIDSNGIVMFGVDSEGIEFEMVRIGPSGANLLTVGNTTVAPDSISTPEMNATLLNIGGRSLTELLQDLPQGVVAWGSLTQDSNYDSSTAGARRAEVQCYLEPNRLYRFSANQHFVNTSNTGGARLVEKLKWSLDSTPIFVGDTAGVTTGTSGRYYLSNNAAYTVPPQSCIIDSSGWSARRTFWGMHIMYSEGSAPIRLLARADYPLTLMVEDLGPSKPSYIKRWNDNNEGGSQDPGPAPVQRYTKTYTSTGFRCYNLDGSDAGREDVVHGLYSGGPSNFRRRGGWLFPSMTGDLSGATVEKIEMYAYCHQTHYSTGSTVNPAVWGGTMATNLTAFTSIYGWKAGSGKWITIPSTYYAGFKSGQYAGVGVIPTSGSADQYARFNPTGAQIRVTYTK